MVRFLSDRTLDRVIAAALRPHYPKAGCGFGVISGAQRRFSRPNR
jgi:hypothetical protein